MYTQSETKSLEEEQAFSQELERSGTVEKGTKRSVEVFSSCILTCLLLMFSSGLACGKDDDSILYRHTFEIGLGVTFLDYEEDLEDLSVELDGFMHGVIGSYTYHNKIMFSASVEYSTGDLHYYGYRQIGTPVATGGEDWIVECRGLFGYDYVIRGSRVLTPFLGIGYRYWNDDIQGYGGYEREIEYWYSPIGLKTCSPLSDNWTWGISLEYDLFWDGKGNTSSLNDPEFDRFPEFDQDSGYGARFSLQFNSQLNKHCSLSIEPYIMYWNIDQSEIVTVYEAPWPLPSLYAQEPDNETTSYGLRVSVEF